MAGSLGVHPGRLRLLVILAASLATAALDLGHAQQVPTCSTGCAARTG